MTEKIDRRAAAAPGAICATLLEAPLQVLRLSSHYAWFGTPRSGAVPRSRDRQFGAWSRRATSLLGARSPREPSPG